MLVPFISENAESFTETLHFPSFFQTGDFFIKSQTLP